ncbi:PrgI family protein [Patescibacteria group bacterium]|nr:MAG: PrgI family protein [Patescibacteria group bacterium]
MPQFVVPQFLDVEDKILGPLTVRQFIILLVIFGVDFMIYKLADFALFLLLGIPIFGFGVVMAFIRVNGQPFHYYLLNLLQFLRRSKLRVWDKLLTDLELRELALEKPLPPPPPKVVKEALITSKLTELSLVVNTGGVYQPEE